MPALRIAFHRDDADPIVSLLPPVRGVPGLADAQTWRLLRVLLLRLGQVPARPGSSRLLFQAGSDMIRGASVRWNGFLDIDAQGQPSTSRTRHLATLASGARRHRRIA